MEPKQQVSGSDSGRIDSEVPTRSRRRSSSSSRLFVVQRHEAQRLHYDLRLEMNGVLASWAVPRGPSLDPGQKRLAYKIEDHPVHHARFEGGISNGADVAENVLVWDIGRWELLSSQGLKSDLIEGKLTFLLRGKRLHGVWMLIRAKDSTRWRLIKQKDKFACSGPKAEITSCYSGSVVRGGVREQEMDAASHSPESSSK